MGFLEKTGKNVDEALEQALNELKTTRDKVNIEVIEEAKNGLFGLFSKKAKIRVTLKDAAAKISDVVEEALDNIKADVQAGKEEYKNIYYGYFTVFYDFLFVSIYKYNNMVK